MQIARYGLKFGRSQISYHQQGLIGHMFYPRLNARKCAWKCSNSYLINLVFFREKRVSYMYCKSVEVK
jgi:hypothetical protein